MKMKVGVIVAGKLINCLSLQCLVFNIHIQIEIDLFSWIYSSHYIKMHERSKFNLPPLISHISN